MACAPFRYSLAQAGKGRLFGVVLPAAPTGASRSFASAPVCSRSAFSSVNSSSCSSLTISFSHFGTFVPLSILSGKVACDTIVVELATVALPGEAVLPCAWSVRISLAQLGTRGVTLVLPRAVVLSGRDEVAVTSGANDVCADSLVPGTVALPVVPVAVDPARSAAGRRVPVLVFDSGSIAETRVVVAAAPAVVAAASVVVSTIVVVSVAVVLMLLLLLLLLLVGVDVLVMVLVPVFVSVTVGVVVLVSVCVAEVVVAVVVVVMVVVVPVCVAVIVVSVSVV